MACIHMYTWANADLGNLDHKMQTQKKYSQYELSMIWRGKKQCCENNSK